MLNVKVLFEKFGIVALACGIALLAPSVALTAAPEFSPLPAARGGADGRADTVISQSAEACAGSAIGCWLGVDDSKPAGNNFGRGGGNIDGGGEGTDQGGGEPSAE